MAREVGNPVRIVVKVGSAVLTKQGRLEDAAVRRLADDLGALLAAGKQVVLVSSGAVASGFGPGGLGLDRSPATIVEKQAAAAVGQPRLMKAWAEAFSRSERSVAQVLFTADDLDNRARFLNARRTLEALLVARIIPIINENDSVSFAEIKLGDNDHLSALTAGLVNADLLVILSSVAGLLANGKTDQVIATVDDPLAAISHVTAEKTGTGVGGMETKLKAAASAGAMGIPTIIADGREAGIVGRVVAGEEVGTHFPAGRGAAASRKRWIGFAARVKGSVTVDDGARKAITQRGASLLPSGIVGVDGEFEAGAPVDIRGKDGDVFGRGLACYPSEDLARIKGAKTADIERLLGYRYSDEVIHRDDLVITRGEKT